MALAGLWDRIFAVDAEREYAGIMSALWRLWHIYDRNVVPGRTWAGDCAYGTSGKEEADL